MPAVQYRARTDRAREQADAPRQPTSTHNTARVEEKMDEKGKGKGEEQDITKKTIFFRILFIRN